MDYKNRSEEELKENYDAANSVTAAAAYVAANSVTAAEAYAAAAYAAEAYAAAVDAAVEYHLNRFFKITGENRKDYEKALEEMRK